MGKREDSIYELKQTEDWITYLLKNSGLPGRRANLELMFTIMDLGDEEFFNKCLQYDEHTAPTNTPGELAAVCGTAGLGTLICQGKIKYWLNLKQQASDSRWRVREGVAIALQKIGQQDFDSLIKNLEAWRSGSPFEKRAVVAGLCEPFLLKKESHAEIVLDILSEIIQSTKDVEDRKSEPFKILRKGLGYGLSVAMAARPEKGKALFEGLMKEQGKEIQWILRENLKKNRLIKMDAAWTVRMKKIML